MTYNMLQASTALRTTPAAQFLKRTAGRNLCRSVKSFIFVATTGRSGSQTLYHLCKNVPGCASFHEPFPEMRGDILSAYNQDEEQRVLKFFKDFKLPAIYKASLKKEWYVETNHTFIKCFADAAVEEFGHRLKVIHMVRDRHEVARSWLNRGSIPGQGSWLLELDAPRNLIQFNELRVQNDRFDHDYFKCLWYWYEIEARIHQFKQHHPEIQVFPLKTEELNDVDRVLFLFEALFGEFDRTALIQQIGSRANSSAKIPAPPADVEQSVIEQFDRLCQERLLH
jgi:hypothetical protein